MGIIRTKPVDQDRDRPTIDRASEPTTHNRENTNTKDDTNNNDDDSMSALITSNIFDDGFFAFPHELAFFEPPCGTAKQVCKRQRQWPRMDIVEHDKEYLVTADTPGVPKDQLKVELTKDGITLSFDRDGIAAKVEDGVLRLTIPKAPESVPKTISIE